MSGSTNKSKSAEPATAPDDAEAEVLAAIRSVRFGSVEITIHNARVVQIERKEKKRLQI